MSCIRFVLLCAVAMGSTASAWGAAQPWYPKASQTCGEYVTKFTSPDFRLVTPRRDPGMAKWAADFEAEAGRDNEELKLLELLGYCNTHAATKLAEVKAHDVIEAFRQAGDAGRPVDAALDEWYRSALTTCGTDSNCSRIATSYRNHSIACSGSDPQACIDRDRDRTDIDEWNAKRSALPATAAQAPAAPVDMPACLQAANKRLAEYCKAENSRCPGGQSLYYMLRAAQQASCGYSALDGPAAPSLEPPPTPRYLQPSPIVPPQLPQTDPSCMGMCMNGKTASAFQACYVQCTR